MKPGSIVKLKDSFTGWKDKERAERLKNQYGYRFPEKGILYMIREIIEDDQKKKALLFEEIINPKIRILNDVPYEVGFGISNFVEILPPQDLSELLADIKELCIA